MVGFDLLRLGEGLPRCTASDNYRSGGCNLRQGEDIIMRELRKSRDKKLFGVAGGMADFFEVDKSVIRAVWIFGSILFPPFLLAYFILAAVIPEARVQPADQPQWQPPDPRPGTPTPEVIEVEVEPVPTTQEEPSAQAEAQAEEPASGTRAEETYHKAQASAPRAGRKLTKSRDRWISGVAGGIAEYFDIDPVLVRVLFLASLFVGGGLLVYIILAVVMPRPEIRYR
jgi:phage shock protein C